VPLVSISHAQREPLSQVDWKSTVYHGLPLDLYKPRRQPGEYLAFLGRISPEKRVDLAIEIAQRSGMKLKIAAKVDKVDREYFDTKIKPLLSDSLVEFVGEIGDKEKGEFLGNAYATLFPIDWPEPFGLVMIESLACGTPVIAARRGSVPEVMEHGATGFIFDTIDEAVAAVQLVSRLSRTDCRAIFEKRFCVARMASDYLTVYGQLRKAHAVRHSERRLHGRDNSSKRTILHPGVVVTGG
jgi:glycosyltransferase involved in cell wall biosynthesis